MKKTGIPVLDNSPKSPRYWDWVPFLIFVFSGEFIKKHKGQLLNYLGNDKYNYDISPNTMYVHYPSVDCTPTGYRMREALRESDVFTFCGFGREDGAREGFVGFKMNEEMRNATSFGDVLPNPETIAIAIRNNYYPGLNPSGTKWNDGFRLALMHFTKGDAPQLALVNGEFRALNNTAVNATNVDNWLLENAPKSLLARVRGLKKEETVLQSKGKTTTTTTTTDVKREVLPTDW